MQVGHLAAGVGTHSIKDIGLAACWGSAPEIKAHEPTPDRNPEGI